MTRSEKLAAALAARIKALEAIEFLVLEYVKTYDWRCEDASGRDGFYSPTEIERAMIADAIAGLHADNDFVRAWDAWRALCLPVSEMHAATASEGRLSPQVVGRVWNEDGQHGIGSLNSIGRVLPDDTPLYVTHEVHGICEHKASENTGAEPPASTPATNGNVSAARSAAATVERAATSGIALNGSVSDPIASPHDNRLPQDCPIKDCVAVFSFADDCAAPSSTNDKRGSTPRTDAELQEHWVTDTSGSSLTHACVPSDFARQLERELAYSERDNRELEQHILTSSAITARKCDSCGDDMVQSWRCPDCHGPDSV